MLMLLIISSDSLLYLTFLEIVLLSNGSTQSMILGPTPPINPIFFHFKAGFFMICSQPFIYNTSSKVNRLGWRLILSQIYSFFPYKLFEKIALAVKLPQPYEGWQRKSFYVAQRNRRLKRTAWRCWNGGSWDMLKKTPENQRD
jgi:hypothetical protein